MVAEIGHEPNRAYFDQRGNIHLNGATLFDGNETPISGPGTMFKMAQGRHTTSSASDVVETGLATVVQVFELLEPDDGKHAHKGGEGEADEGGRGHKGGRGHRPEHDKPEHEKHGHEKPPPTVTVGCAIGDQVAAPGSIVISSTETAGDDPTPKPATTFGKSVHWLAIGT
jgi:hypothetical protein